MLFKRAVSWLEERLPKEGLRGRHRELEEYLRIEKPGGERVSVKAYYAGRLIKFFGGFVCCLVFMISAVFFSGKGDQDIEGNKIKRPAGGEETCQTELTVFMEGEEEPLVIQARIQPRKLTPKEVQELFAAAGERLDQLIPGENPSMDEIRQNLNLVAFVALPQGRVEVDWTTDPLDLVDAFGVLQREAHREGELLRLKASLRFQGHEAEYEAVGTVYPEQYTGKEKWVRRSEQAVRRVERQNPYSGEIELPERVDGVKVSWRQTDDSSATILVFLCPAAFLCLFLRENRRVGETVKRRRQQLLMDYPQMVFQMTMLLGAGLTIRGAFFKAAEEYKPGKKGRRRYVYEEIYLACREMENGIPEAEAYENFGRRCGHPVYRKLGMVLSQNLKKGSEGLAELLEQEAVLALEDQKTAVRKLGEEAGTKLLFPMMLMLIVVLVILMVPAMMSF